LHFESHNAILVQVPNNVKQRQAIPASGQRYWESEGLLYNARCIII
jgi:hypothetical protein